MKKIKYLIMFFLLSALNFKITNIALSQAIFGPGQDQTDAFRDESGFGVSTPATMGHMIATVIQASLGLLGIIFLVLIISAGFKWMTASGNEEKATEAKDMIYRAIIGLIILVGAYAITYFVFNALDWAGGEQLAG